MKSPMIWGKKKKMSNKPKNLEEWLSGKIKIWAGIEREAKLQGLSGFLVDFAREVAHASLDAVGVEEMPIDKSLVEEHKDKVDEWLREGGKK